MLFKFVLYSSAQHENLQVVELEPLLHLLQQWSNQPADVEVEGLEEHELCPLY